MTAARKRIGVTRAHLEEDAGKSLHEGLPGLTGIDLNRAGTPLIEIVSEPRHALGQGSGRLSEEGAHPGALPRHLRRQHAGRLVPLRRQRVGAAAREPRSSAPAPRSRTSTRSASSRRRSTTRSRARSSCSRAAARCVQETRLYDPDKGETRSMRSKEEANDYRYFPDPDLLPVEIDQAYIDAVCERTLPELPDQKAQRFASEYGLSAYDAGVLTASARAGRLLRGGGARSLGGHARSWPPTGSCGELAAAAQPRWPRDQRPAASTPTALAALLAAHRRQHHLRQDRQGRVRGDVGRRRERRRDHRGAGPAADHRRVGAIERGHRRGDGRRIRASWPTTAPARTSCSASSSAR